MGRAGRPPCRRSQSSFSSAMWSSAQASTKRRCVRGSCPAISFDWINTEYPDVLLAIRGEMGCLMGAASFHEHANDDAEEPLLGMRAALTS
jgi:hypothetical protein